MNSKLSVLAMTTVCLLLFSSCGEGGVVTTTTTTTAPTTTTTAETTTTTTTVVTTTATTTTTTRKTTTTPTTTTETTTTTTTIDSAIEKTASTVFTTYRRTAMTTTSRSGKTIPTVPTVFNEDALRADLNLKLDTTAYYLGSEMNIYIENTTEQEIFVNDAYAVLKKSSNGEWDCVYSHQTLNERKKEPGDVYTICLLLKEKGLTKHPLQEGCEYKLIWGVDGQWIGADFTILPSSKP